MTKTISKIGNSQGLVFDSALMELARLKVGDEVDVIVHPGGAIVVTPLRPTPTPQEVSAVIGKTVKDYRKTLKKLA